MRKIFSSRGVKFLFVALYIVSNIWGASTIIERNELIADHAGWPAPNAEQVIFALILIIISYLIMLFVGSGTAENKSRFERKLNSKTLSVTIFLMQIIFFIFILIYSAGKAGQDAEKAGGVLRFLFYVINPDMLFLVYYGATMYAKGKIRYRNVNLILFFISNLARGWIGQVFFIVFIGATAWAQSSNGKLTSKKLFDLTVLAPLFLIMSSLLLYVKIALREGTYAIIDLIENLNFVDVFYAFYENLFSRLQLISTVSFQIFHKDELTQFIQNGIVGNFYTDGLPQQTLYKILNIFPGENLNLFLWKNYIPGDSSGAQTTVQPGLVGWFYLLPSYWILPFIAYIIFLVFLNLKLIRFIGGNGLRHLSWFAMLIFLIPSWLGAYISFIWAILIFIGIISIIHENPEVNLPKKENEFSHA